MFSRSLFQKFINHSTAGIVAGKDIAAMMEDIERRPCAPIIAMARQCLTKARDGAEGALEQLDLLEAELSRRGLLPDAKAEGEQAK